MKKLAGLLTAAGVVVTIELVISCLILLKQLSTSKTIETFQRIYYATGPYAHTYFLGIPSGQYPTDNWVMQEIIAEIKPDFIIANSISAKLVNEPAKRVRGYKVLVTLSSARNREGLSKLTFVADKPPPSHIAYQEVLVAAETGGEYFL